MVLQEHCLTEALHILLDKSYYSILRDDHFIAFQKDYFTIINTTNTEPSPKKKKSPTIPGGLRYFWCVPGELASIR